MSDQARFGDPACNDPRDATSLTINCSRGDYIWLEYAFRLPADAINLRPSIAYDPLFTGASGSISIEGWRNARSKYRAYVAVSNRMRVRLDTINVRIHLPNRRDNRACVTRGEWAVVNPQFGGSGGTQTRVATVFDSDGKRVHISPWMDGFRHQTRAYRKCGGGKYRIGFHQYRGDPWWSYRG